MAAQEMSRKSLPPASYVSDVFVKGRERLRQGEQVVHESSLGCSCLTGISIQRATATHQGLAYQGT